MILKWTALQWILKSWMWTASIWLCCALVNTVLHGVAYIVIQSNFASVLFIIRLLDLLSGITFTGIGHWHFHVVYYYY